VDVNVVSVAEQVKKQGKQADNTQFRAQLDALGQKIVQVTADGNCFFMFVFLVRKDHRLVHDFLLNVSRNWFVL